MRVKLFRLLYFLRVLKLFPQYFFHYEVRKFVKKGDVVIDIGANQGIYTKIFSDCGAYVHAIEPIRKFWDSLEKINTDRINLIPFAMGGKIKSVRMERWRNTSGAYRISKDGNLHIQMMQGSLWFNKIAKLNFIKIDVEGSELPIIEDMAGLILKHKPTILIETDKIAEVLSYLKGYEVIKQVSNDYLIGVI